ncbi:GNAT family N-acetyltransferase [Lacibacterium aquatile]|uniref:GNAT family N-acetyltransferase n=1 Tax=Lacibacterium aquatile TaxID=1168082 RepID=A0ABW5DT35_9PROT
MIETERLILRSPSTADAAALLDYAARNKAHLAPWEPSRSDAYYTLAHWQRLLADQEAEITRGTATRFLIFQHQAPDRVIGTVNFSQIFRGPFLACYLGYGLDGEAEGKGLMFEGVQAGITHMFETVGLHRIMANYVPTNERSGRLLRRLGFAVEGYARDYLYINGAWRDHIMTALNNPQPVMPA